MAMEHRDRMIAAFTTDASVKVFLMSLKAGGVALNLTAASHVMLMDPWWNPAVEQQVFLSTRKFHESVLAKFIIYQEEVIMAQYSTSWISSSSSQDLKRCQECTSLLERYRQIRLNKSKTKAQLQELASSPAG